jgi:hypothetical protein
MRGAGRRDSISGSHFLSLCVLAQSVVKRRILTVLVPLVKPVHHAVLNGQIV